MNDTIFSPAFGNKPVTLVGRDKDLKCLKDGLASLPGTKERARLIIGQRGLGKTVLLLEMAEYARANGYIVASPTVVSGGMLERILEKLYLDSEAYLSRNRPKVTGGTVGFFGFSAGIQTEPASESGRSFAFRLQDFCKKAGSIGKGVLILVDEIHANSDELKELIITYQEMVGEGLNLSMIFAGLPAAVSRTLNQHVLTFFNRASKLFLEPIAIPEIIVYYHSCFEKLGIQISDEWITEAALKTDGSPYLMQLIGHYITISSSDDGELTETAFQNALKLSREEFVQDICETTLSPLSEKDIEFLRAMSSDHEETEIRNLCIRMGADSSLVQRYKTRLIQAGIIKQPKRGYVSFAVPYLKQYFQSQEENAG